MSRNHKVHLQQFLLITVLFPGLTVSFVVLLRMQAAEGRQEELAQRGAKEKRELELRIEEMEEKEQVLQARIEALQADNDFTNERLAALQGTEHTPTHTGAVDTLSVGQRLSALVVVVVCPCYSQCG